MTKNELAPYPERKSLEPKSRLAIIKTLGYLSGVPLPDYIVIGGANLVLRGIKDETPDLDLLVSDNVFEWLKMRDGAELHEPPYRAKLEGATNNTVWVKNRSTPIPISATTSMGDGYYPISYATHRHEIEYVDGIPCLPLSTVIASKEALQRPKDIADLTLIANFEDIPLVLPNPTILRPLLDS